VVGVQECEWSGLLILQHSCLHAHHSWHAHGMRFDPTEERVCAASLWPCASALSFTPGQNSCCNVARGITHPSSAARRCVGASPRLGSWADDVHLNREFLDLQNTKHKVLAPVVVALEPRAVVVSLQSPRCSCEILEVRRASSCVLDGSRCCCSGTVSSHAHRPTLKKLPRVTICKFQPSHVPRSGQLKQWRPVSAVVTLRWLA
jgi:hypothetical protein